MAHSVKAYEESSYCPIRITGQISEGRFELHVEDPLLEIPKTMECPGALSEIDDLCWDIHKALGSVDFAHSSFIDLPEAERKKRSLRIAKIGRDLFKLLFSDADAEWLLRRMGADGGVTIHVSDDRVVSLPWDVLYTDKVLLDHNDEPLTDQQMGRFLGENILFVRVTAVRSAASVEQGTEANLQDPFSRVPTPLLSAGPVKAQVGHIYDDMLDTAKAPTVHTWHHPHRAKLDLKPLDPLSNAVARRVMQGLIVKFFREAHDAIHIDCHATTQKSDGTPEFEMRIKSGYLAQYNDLKAWSLATNTNVLVFLGLCHSDVTSNVGRDSPARLIQRNGARSVVGTLAAVNNILCLLFSSEFYGHLLDGLVAGEAFMRTRKSLFTQSKKNPAVLLFTLHGAVRYRLGPNLWPVAA